MKCSALKILLDRIPLPFLEMPDLHSLPEGWRPENAVRNNGPNDLALERWKLRELAEGWPMYRDACEWENFESIFAPTAYIYTTWTGYLPLIRSSTSQANHQIEKPFTKTSSSFPRMVWTTEPS